MQPVINHSFAVSETEALKLQEILAKKVVKIDMLDEVLLIAGVDVAYHKNSDTLLAAIVVLNAETLEIVESSTAEDQVQFPYIPGLFSFREIPPLIKAFAKLTVAPNLIVCDGQGIAHPRRFGLASHLGVIFDVPSIGCGKTRLIGTYQEPELARGAEAPLLDNDEIIGSVLRSQDKLKPLYISIGHRISLTTATKWILKLCRTYRLPETTRKTDHLVNTKLKHLISIDPPKFF